MKTLMLAAALLACSQAEAQTLSQAAHDAFYSAHLCEPEGLPPATQGLIPALGSRRFVPTAITYRIQQSGAGYVSTVRGTMSKIATKMAGVQVLSEVPWSSPATITWRIGSSTTAPGQPPKPLTNGCRFNPLAYAGSPASLTAVEVVCKTASQVSENLAMHELWWHGYLTYCDLNCPNSFACHATASGAPNYEGVPGHQELARWLQTVPAGTFPPQ